MDHFESYEFVVSRVTASDEEERGISSVDDFGVWKELELHTNGDGWACVPLYSRKLHMRVLRARTSCETSFTILALSLGESVVNHFASLWQHWLGTFQ